MSTDELKELYDTYYERLYLMACRILKDSFAAQDVVQDVFISIHDKKMVGDPRGYLCNAIGNKCRDYWTSRKLRTFVDTSNVDIGSEEMNLYFIEATYLAEVYKSIEKLPEKARETIKLYLSGEKTQAIANYFKVSPQCALNNKQHAIKLLRNLLTV